MSRPRLPRLLRPVLPLLAVLALGSPATSAGSLTLTGKPVVKGVVDAAASTLDAAGPNDLLVTQAWFPAGSIDPTNVPVLSGDFASMSASIAPEEALRVRADDGSRMATGRGVLVAVLDSGFNLASPALAGVVAGGYDAFDLDSDCNDDGNGTDEDGDGVVDSGVGHGTFVSSLVTRCAPGAAILPIRIANDEGRGTGVAVSEGLRYAVERGARVINVSFALDMTSYATKYWLDAAERRGVVVVCAAGNEGVDSVQYFAKHPATLAVGAVDAQDRRAGFSNYGAGVDLYAPGDFVQASYGSPRAAQLARWSGTSFSTPFVSAAAALVVQRHPTWSASQVRDALKASVDPAVPLAGERMYGGRINLMKAASR